MHAAWQIGQAELEPMMTTTTTRELPADILFSNILPRVPARSVTRFKCVSKQWHSFLRTPGFLQMHQLHVNKNSNDDQNNHDQKLLFIFLTNTRPWEYRTIDCDSPKDGFTTSHPFPFDIEVGQKISIITSLNGMVCVGITQPSPWQYSHLILWNPYDHKTLAKPGCFGPHKICLDRYELYYSSSENDYRLLWLTRLLNVYIYSLKSDSWRKVEEPNTNTNTNSATVSSHHDLIMSSVMLNDQYDFLRKSFDQFEGSGEKLLNDDQIRRTDFMGFMVLRGGSIHFCVANANSLGDEYDRIELWRMSRELAQHWEWATTANLFKYDDDHLMLELVLREGHKLLHFMRNGNWLMYSPREQYIYQLDTQLTKHFMCSNNFAFDRGGLNVYMETLVSPNQYNI